MESNRSKRKVILQKELPFAEQIPRHHLDLFQNKTTNHSVFISRQEFLKLLEINVNK